MHRLLVLIFLLAGECCAAQRLYVGPEVYHMCRWRQGGTQQDGWLYGGRVGYDRVEACSLYWGVDYLYATGHLDGKSGSGRDLCSDITDSIVEGRLGFTFVLPEGRGYCFTPFVGYGYFHEENAFHSPSPIPFTFTDTFEFITVGFLSGVNLTPLLSMGIDFRARFMQNGRSRVTDDPMFEDQTLQMNNELQLRVEVPFTYHHPCSCFDLSIVPFYAFRHFGGREAYPFDFIDTKFNLFGLRAEIGLNF